MWVVMMTEVQQRFGWKGRFVAAGVHLLISLLVAAVAAALVFGVWYPYPFREISGGLSLFGLLISVDVVVGPLLTWLVFNRRKPAKELRRDLAIVGCLQLVALVYGLWSMHQARPMYLIHEVDRFVTVSAADIDPADLNDALPEFRAPSHFGLRTLGLREPKDQDEKLKALSLSLVGKDLSLQPRFWQALSPANREAILKASKPLEALRARGEKARVLVDEWLHGQSGSASELRYFPLVSRENYWAVVLDKNLNMVGYLPIDPF